MNSSIQRSEHANNIDQTVAMMLINTVIYDMSPLVRKVSLFFLLLNKFLKILYKILQ